MGRRVLIAPSADSSVSFGANRMVVGLLQLDLRIPESQSLKGKRQILLSLKTRLRQRFNISISETENQEKWQLATLSVVCVGTDQTGVNRCLNYVVDLVREDRGVELIDYRLEFF